MFIAMLGECDTGTLQCHYCWSPTGHVGSMVVRTDGVKMTGK